MSTSDYTNIPPDPNQTQTDIISPITQALKDNNITLERIASKWNDLIDCKRAIGIDEHGNTVEVNDTTNQLKATIESGKLLQAYPAEKHDVNLLGATEMSIAVTVFRAQKSLEKPPDAIAEDKEG